MLSARQVANFPDKWPEAALSAPEISHCEFLCASGCAGDGPLDAIFPSEARQSVDDGIGLRRSPNKSVVSPPTLNP
jgi:hypothetical protein